MTIQATITGGKNLARDIQTLIEQEAEESLRDKYQEFALDLFRLSPIYPSAKYSTGAYISSHGVQFNSTSVPGGGIKSKGLRKGQLKGSASFSDILTDINNASLEQLSSVTFYNNSPHAQAVEGGGPNWKRAGYYVYSQAVKRAKA